MITSSGKSVRQTAENSLEIRRHGLPTLKRNSDRPPRDLRQLYSVLVTSHLSSTSLVADCRPFTLFCALLSAPPEN